MDYEMGAKGHLVWTHAMSLIARPRVELVNSSALPIKQARWIAWKEAIAKAYKKRGQAKIEMK